MFYIQFTYLLHKDELITYYVAGLRQLIGASLNKTDEKSLSLWSLNVLEEEYKNKFKIFLV